MSLQTIINNCDGITIDRRKVVGVQITRNEIPRTTLTPTKQPWRFIVTMPPALRYYNNRDLLEDIDTLDRYQAANITFSNNGKLNWIFAYQGSLSGAQISGISVSSFTGTNLVLGSLPSVGSGTIMFKKNDIIQIGSNPYPFAVTSQVTRGGAGTVTVPVHRPNIISSSVSGQGITVGNGCTFRVFCPDMPTYKLVPGGAIVQNGVTLNNALIEFQGAFTLYEYVGEA